MFSAATELIIAADYARLLPGWRLMRRYLQGPTGGAQLSRTPAHRQGPRGLCRVTTTARLCLHHSPEERSSACRTQLTLVAAECVVFARSAERTAFLSGVTRP